LRPVVLPYSSRYCELGGNYLMVEESGYIPGLRAGFAFSAEVETAQNEKGMH
jgi:hypothetical protein